MKFSRNALFHIKTRFCLKYFVHDCRNGHRYTRYKMCHSMAVIKCTKQHLSNI